MSHALELRPGYLQVDGSRRGISRGAVTGWARMRDRAGHGHGGGVPGRGSGVSFSQGGPTREYLVLTGELKSKIDRIWDAFWSGGISNPLEVMEQITYLLFLKRLDDLQTLKENKAHRLGDPIESPVFPAGDDDWSRPYADYRWSSLKNLAPAEMYDVISDHVFPYLRTLGGDGSTYATHMKDARFTIPTPSLLAKAVDGIDAVPMEDRDTKGDVYEYMLAKIATAGQNGQFRTPRHRDCCTIW